MKTITVQSPGRINLIGEHTDYNDGFVLPAAIDKKTIFQLKKNGSGNTVNVRSGNLKEAFTFELDSIQRIQSGWQNYIMGVVDELKKLGAIFTGFDAQFKGNVPIGSGMSSSAALECSLAFGLNMLFNLGLDQWQLIKACQMAEHNFAGIKCGIMDQFASIMGKKDQVILLDCRSLDFQYFPLDLGNYQLLLLNTNVSHALASSEYNSRRSECEAGVAILQKSYPDIKIKSLRDITSEMLIQAKGQLPPRIFNRCKHVISENTRVLQATEALRNKDFYQLGKLMNQSHFSLQSDYEVSCPELDYLVQLALNQDDVLGSRMMGGGFGGCTINIIKKSRVKEFIELAFRDYRNRFGIDLSPYSVSIGDGAGVVSE